MKTFSIIVCAFIASITISYAQTQQQQVQVIKPSIPLSEIVFAVELLNNIELRGSEVEALMDIKGILIPPVVKANNEKKPATDIVTVEFKINQAQNLLGFLQRAKLSGAEADRYSKFVQTIVNSAQPKK